MASEPPRLWMPLPDPKKPTFPIWDTCPTCGLPMLLRSDGKCRNPTCKDAQ